MSYYHSIAGIARMEGTDLSKTDVWIPASFLAVNVVYDVATFWVSEDTVERYFGVLFGEEYYPSRWDDE